MDLPEKQKPLSNADLHKVIQHFTHQQLTEIVATASLRHADVLEAVRSIADQDTANRRLSITGLSNETTSQKLRQIFAAYGDLKLSQTYVRTTTTVKGSGYVTYKHIDGALRALKKRHKLIDGKMTVTQLASSRFRTAFKPKVVNSNQKSSTSFGGGGSNGVYGYGGSVGGLGGGKFGYGGVRQGPSVRLSQPLPLNSSRLPSYCGDSDDFDSVDFYGDDSDIDYSGVSAYSGGLGLPRGPSSVSAYSGNYIGLGLHQGPATTTKVHVPRSADRVKRELELVAAEDVPRSGGRVKREVKREAEVHVPAGSSGDRVKREVKQEVVDTEVHVPKSGDRVKLEVKQEVVDIEVHVPRSGDRVKREVKREVVNINQQSEAMMDMVVRNGSDQSMRMSSEGYYNLSSDSDD